MDPPICWGEVEPAGGEKGEKAGEKTCNHKIGQYCRFKWIE